MEKIIENIRNHFSGLYDEEPVIIASPGRINLIGEHTDYNEGFVMPAAIDRRIYFALAQREDTRCEVHALDLDDAFVFHSSDELSPSEKVWRNYILGVVQRIKELTGKSVGFNCVFSGDIPIGAGLSSSAALEGGFVFALNQMFDLNLKKLDMAKIGQWAEHNFVGVKCGLMDQYANIYGQADKAIQLDCRSYDYTLFDTNFDQYSILLFDTQVKHELGSSEYNVRRAECHEGVEFFQTINPEIKSLRDVSPEMVEQHKNDLSEKVYERCVFVTSENRRVELAGKALASKDYHTFGQLLYASHEGLSKRYEVSCEELDYLVELSHQEDLVLGSRMMGGGFGGCTINLIETEHCDAIAEKFKKQYKDRFGIDLLAHKVNISDGVKQIASLSVKNA